MKLIDVPVFNEDGSIKVTHVIGPEEAQALLQFAINFLTATGLQTQMVVVTKDDEDQQEFKFDD